MKRLCALLLLTLMVSVLTASAAYAGENEALRGSVVRLHIRADSDDPEAQRVKLLVRDEVLRETARLTDGCRTAGEAAAVLQKNLDVFTSCADRVLAAEGSSYRSAAYFGEDWFPTRTYAGLTLPAGRYTGLVLALGSGEGQNWWCVMFPPLCYQGEDAELSPELRETLERELGKEAAGEIISDGRVVLRWKTPELWDRLRAWLSGEGKQ